MSQSVYYYKIYCPTESNVQYKWNTSEPTTCNNGHAISGTPIIMDEITSDKVEIKEELPSLTDTPTNGTYKFEGFELSVPQSANAVMDLSFPYPITLMDGWFYPRECQIGDVIHCTVSPDTIVGIIVAPIYSGNTELTVNSTVIDNVIPGYNLDLFDSQTFTINDVGRIQTIDSANSKITMETAVTNNFTDIGNVYVRLGVSVIKGFKIVTANGRYGFAEKKIGGKYVPANTVIRIDYCNREGNAKVFDFNLEYLY